MKKPVTYASKKTSLVPSDRLIANLKTLEPEIAALNAARDRGYETPYASINCPTDAALRGRVIELVNTIKKHQPKMLIVIGIGGSNVGTLAVHQAVMGLIPSGEIELCCADTR